MAHATMLEKIGVLKKAERESIVRGLEDIGQEIADGKFKWREDELRRTTSQNAVCRRAQT